MVEQYTHRSSFSQHNLFHQCPRSWYYSAILKVQTEQDFKYANAGSSIHKVLDKFYSKQITTIEQAKEDFEQQWKRYNLDATDLKLEKDAYWNMILNGIMLKKELTSTEMKIFFPEIVAYIDGVDTASDELLDWKSSTRRPDNEIEYRLQLRLYAWLYHRKFGRIPKKCTVHYLKYAGSKGELSFEFTEQDIKDAEEWFYSILLKMQEYIKNPGSLPPFNQDYFWSPYKAYWDKQDNGSAPFKIHIFGNHLQLEGPITELLEKGIKKKFSYELKNAHWIKKARPQASTTVQFWSTGRKALPLGFRDGLIKTLQDFAEHKKIGLSLDIVDHRTFNQTVVAMPAAFINGKKLRDYQTEAVDIFIRKKVGILQIGTGGGKTEIATEIIRRLGIKTLFIVDKIELLRQTKQRIEEALGIPVKQIGAGLLEIDGDVTVATIQTLKQNVNQLHAFLGSIRFAVFDETHKVAARSYSQLSKYLVGTEYRLGLSGTAFRDDGNDMLITAVTGNIIHNLGTAVLIDKGWLVKPQIIFIKDYMDEEVIERKETECKTGLINETDKYPVLYDKFIANNIDRNLVIQNHITINPGKKILVLTKLIEHGQTLQQMLPGSQHLFGGTPRDERLEMFKNFIAGTHPVLISTISIFAEGIDVPSLDMVVNAAANKGDVKTIQILGRVLRTLEGKKNAYYVDFIDEPRMLTLASRSRKKALEREGHDVVIKKHKDQ